MIKATVTTENDGIRTDSYIEGTCLLILKELVELIITVIVQLREKFPSLTVDKMMEKIDEMIKYGLDNYEEEPENV